MRTRPRSLALFFVAGLVTALPAAARSSPSGWSGLVGAPRPAVALADRDIVVLTTPSLAQRIASGGPATEAQERTWTSQALAAQQQVLTTLAEAGLEVRPDYEYTHVLDGFAARLDPRAVALLQHDPQVAAVFPVRAAYPASVSNRPGSIAQPITLPAADGRGVTIALLDTGVDLNNPFVFNHVLPGLDAVNGNGDAHAVADPQDSTLVETHGTQMAGILAAVAPGATVLPIRIAGWQPAQGGSDAVYTRSDQIIEGLELAVDPNQDGDAHDAVRLALVGVAEPYASFTDDAEAEAVHGAFELGTVVIAPAGNDGAAGPAFGSVAGPAAAPDAVAVAAVDSRPGLAGARVVLRTGLDVVYDQVQPLLGARVPSHAQVLEVAIPGRRGFFDAAGRSLVAGRAAVAPEGANPAVTASDATAAGAAAVLLYGDPMPAGGLSANIPVAWIPASAARALLRARAAGHDVGVAIGGGRIVANNTKGFVAPFSSQGLAFDGGVKPDVSAPGFNVASAGGAVTGTSAAAANVAGAAALIVQMRPALDAAALRSLLVGYAQPGGAPVTQAGAGTFRVGAAAVGELASDETTISFGVLAHGGSAMQTITLHNVSTRRLRVDLSAVTTSGETAPLQFSILPRVFTLAPGAAETVGVNVSTRVAQRSRVALGAIEAQVLGSETLRIPWALLLRAPPSGGLVFQAALDRTSFVPSDVDPAVLTARVGAVSAGQIEPVAQLAVLLYTSSGRYLGSLAHLRDLLPGTYAFGITGRGPTGVALQPGSYELRIVARSALGSPSRAVVRFSVV